MKNILVFALLLIFKININAQDNSDTITGKLIVTPSILCQYNDLHKLLIEPAISFTFHKHELSFALLISKNKDDYFYYKYNRLEPKIGGNIGYKYQLNKSSFLNFNINLLKHNGTIETHYNNEDATHTIEEKNYIVNIGYGVRFKIINNLYLISAFGIGLEKIINIETLYVPIYDYYAFKNLQIEYMEIIFLTKLGFEYNIYINK